MVPRRASSMTLTLQLRLCLTSMTHPRSVDDLSAGLRERTGGSVISWTTLMSTLSRVDGWLSWNSPAWPHGRGSTMDVAMGLPGHIPDGSWEAYAGSLAQYDGRVWTYPDIPRGFAKQRIILHLFSARLETSNTTWTGRVLTTWWSGPSALTSWSTKFTATCCGRFWLEAIKSRKIA